MYSSYSSGPDGSVIAILVIFGLILLAVTLGIMYAIIKAAVTHAMRTARSEERLEYLQDQKAGDWLSKSAQESVIQFNRKKREEFGS